MAASRTDGKWGKYHTYLTQCFTYSFQSLISIFIDLTCTRNFYILLFEKKQTNKQKNTTKSLVLISSLTPSSVGLK